MMDRRTKPKPHFDQYVALNTNQTVMRKGLNVQNNSKNVSS